MILYETFSYFGAQDSLEIGVESGRCFKFSPQSLPRKQKTPTGNTPNNENRQKTNTSLHIDTLKFDILFGNVKVEDLRCIALNTLHDLYHFPDALRLGLVTHAAAVADIGDRAGKVGVDHLHRIQLVRCQHVSQYEKHVKPTCRCRFERFKYVIYI